MSTYLEPLRNITDEEFDMFNDNFKFLNVSESKGFKYKFNDKLTIEFVAKYDTYGINKYTLVFKVDNEYFGWDYTDSSWDDTYFESPSTIYPVEYKTWEETITHSKYVRKD